MAASLAARAAPAVGARSQAPPPPAPRAHCRAPAAAASWRQRGLDAQHPSPLRRTPLHPASALPPGLEAYVEGGGGGGWAEALLGQQPDTALRVLAATAAAYLGAAWPDRPRGWCRKDLVEVRASPVAGLGVFARTNIPAGAVLGAYPGRPRTAAAAAAKAAAGAQGAWRYTFRTRDGYVLDPTDADGQLSSSPVPGLPWPPVDATLALVNEPPLGAGGSNVMAEDDPRDPLGLVCVASVDIPAGAELFLDYGVYYDRSGYGPGAAEQTGSSSSSSSSSSGDRSKEGGS